MFHPSKHGFLLAWLSLLAVSKLSHAAGPIQFNRDIRPILSDNCFSCHGPDSLARQADLRLDDRISSLAAQAIVPGHPLESELIKRILSKDPDQVMPPPKSHKSITSQQLQLLSDWIANGAEYQPHWSFIAPKLPDLPEVRNKEWIQNSIDRFVLAKLEAMGLEPAPEADLQALVRRVTLDLTGLPPSTDDVQSVIDDPSPDRYQRYVDRLLDRESWGEHRGRYWLDYARFADTHGIHFDNFREVWAYRDWVIDAFNRNMPFDQFTVEQLAGDLIPHATLEQKIATGFVRCNITTSEGGAIDEEYRVLYTRDRTETMAQVWLGLTAGCAVCHDHKFDPISQKDFYALSAFFNNTSQPAMDGNRKDTPPIVNVPAKADRDRYPIVMNTLKDVEASQQKRKEAAKTRFETWRQLASNQSSLTWATQPSHEKLQVYMPLDDASQGLIRLITEGNSHRVPILGKASWQAGHVAESSWVNPKEPSVALESIANFERDQSFTVSLWLYLPEGKTNGSVLSRMDVANAHRGWDIWIEDNKLAMHLIHRWPENAIKSTAKNALTTKKWHQVTYTYDGSSKVDGLRIYVDGKQVDTNTSKNVLSKSIRTETAFRIGGRSTGSPTPGVSIQDLKIYSAVVSYQDIQTAYLNARMLYLGSKDFDSLSKDEQAEFYDWYLHQHDDDYRRLIAEARELSEEKTKIEKRGTIAHVMNERKEPAKAFVLFRGEYDQRRDEVEPATPSSLPGMKSELIKNRLGLAQWLLQPENPLTARVTVNRFWQEVFGTGIVPTAGDFGITGQSPSHPELLDFLAVSFREDGWNIKSFFRMMVTSATYRQSCSIPESKSGVDPQNRMLSRGPRFRMDAEMVRDNALAISGLLVPKIGGPSVRPYQPPGVWEAVAMPGSDTRNYVEDQGEGLYRRSMYTFWKRSAPPASMEIMNAPNRETCMVKRERTNTPLQALITMNDPQYIEAARHLAQQILLTSQDDTNIVSLLQKVGRKVVARAWSAEELTILQESQQKLLNYYQSHPEAATHLLAVGKSKRDESIAVASHAAWTMLLNQIMNLDEVLNK